MKNILIVDPLSDGHHTTFVAYVTGALLSKGYSVCCYHPNSDKVRDWLINQGISTTNFTIQYENTGDLFSDKKSGKVQLIINQIKKWQSLKRCIRKAAESGLTIDLVFIMYIDTYYIPGINRWVQSLFFPFNWICLCLRPSHYKRITIKERAKNLFADTYSMFLSNRCKAIGLLEEELVSNSPDSVKYKQKYVQFPDFSDTAVFNEKYDLVETIKSKAGGRKVIGTLGSLSKRKGLIPLFRVAELLKNEPCFFIFIGQLYEYSFTPEENLFIREFVSKQPTNCYFHFTHIPDESHFNSIVKICDIVTTLYENFPFSSNFFSKAAEFRKLIIGSGSGCIGNRIQTYRFGLTVDCQDIDKIGEVIQQMLLNYDKLIDAARFQEYLALHSSKNISMAIDRLLQKVN